jgi:uracil-DNA glycosylase
MEKGTDLFNRFLAAISGNFDSSSGEAMDCPKLLSDVMAVQARLSQVHDAHMAPLTSFVHRLRSSMGPEAAIPYMDPWDAGVDAEVLFLLEAPGPKARNSGFVSMNNPDKTAKNIFITAQDAGVVRKRILLWNTVPWYIGSGQKIRPANSADIAAGIPSLNELLQLLPQLRAIVLIGSKAQKALTHIQNNAPHLKIFLSPHPSPMFVNRKPENREKLLGCWRDVGAFLRHSDSQV